MPTAISTSATAGTSPATSWPAQIDRSAVTRILDGFWQATGNAGRVWSAECPTPQHDRSPKIDSEDSTGFCLAAALRLETRRIPPPETEMSTGRAGEGRILIQPPPGRRKS